MKDDKLAVIIKDSGLETTKAKEVLEQFGDYFKIADEWEKKAKMIVVKDASQTADMKMARVGRIFLRDKINDVEKFRKKLKDQYLRGGRAVDTVAHFLKDLMVPTRDYLHEQERFVQIQEAIETERKKNEVERRMLEEEEAAKKAEIEQIEQERLENIRLRKAQKKLEASMKAEREANEKENAERERLAKIRREDGQARQDLLFDIGVNLDFDTCVDMTAIAWLKFYRTKKDEYKLAKIEQEKQEKENVERERKVEAERKNLVEKAESERKEKERIQAELDALIECPFCHKKFKLEDK